MLIKIYHQIFFDGASSKDHGTLLANMTKLRFVSDLQYYQYIMYNNYSVLNSWLFTFFFFLYEKIHCGNYDFLKYFLLTILSTVVSHKSSSHFWIFHELGCYGMGETQSCYH